MYDKSRRYDFQNSEKLSISDLHTLFLDTDMLTEYLYTHKDEFSNIREIDSATDSESFYSEHVDQIDEITNRIFDLTSLNNEDELITLFRGVELGPEDMEPDMEEPGMCWTYDYDTAVDFVNQFDPSQDADYAPCIITAQFKAKDIDWLYSAACMLDEMDEKEIRTYKDSKPVAIDYEVL
jgi:hypothetical protein